MRKLIPASVIMVALFSGAAFAKDKDHDNHHDHDRVRNHDRDHDRDRDHRAGSRPAGWDKGKKTGWGNSNIPPGQAKKNGRNDDHRHHNVEHHTDRHTDRRPTYHRTADHRPSARHYGPHAPVTTATTTTTTTATSQPVPPTGRPVRTSR